MDKNIQVGQSGEKNYSFNSESQSQTDKINIPQRLDNLDLLYKKNEKTIGRIETITYLGFFIIILMVFSMVASYIEFIYSSVRNDDYKYNLSTKVNDTDNQMKILKNCLNVSGWLNPKCLEN